jgi:site-specific recombinase XerD
VADIGNFLAEMFDAGKEYATINGYRSAISAFHPEIEGQKTGQHPYITRLMKGVFNKRPPVPKYTETWEVGRVLNTIKAFGDNRTMNTKQLTLKLAMLMALSSAGRSSELVSLSTKYMVDEGEQISFQMHKVYKTAKPGKPLMKLSFQTFDLDARIDVCECIRAYIDRTQEWRNKTKGKDLFLSYIEPHKPIVSSSFARWLKSVLKVAGIDTSVYKGHSVRSAATSKARATGLSTQQIVERANWTNAATFFRFYNKEIQESEFQNAVFQE